MSETQQSEPEFTLTLRLCPYCMGEEPARSDCEECKGAGLFDDNSEPFFAPPPFDRWTPERLAALSAASLQRGENSPLQVRPRRLTQSQIVERLLHALGRGSQEHSTVKLNWNAKGDTQIEVSVRTGEKDVETVDEARIKAEQTYDHLRERYPRSGMGG